MSAEACAFHAAGQVGDLYALRRRAVAAWFVTEWAVHGTLAAAGQKGARGGDVSPPKAKMI